MTRVALACCLAIFVLPPFLAFPVEPSSKHGADLYGEPLPADAKARLGTTRFRPGRGLLGLGFTPDSKQVVTASEWGIRYWDPATGRNLKKVDVGSPRLIAFALSADGKVAASLNYLRDPETLEYKKTLRFWNVPAGTQSAEASLKEPSGFGVIISDDGSRAAMFRGSGKSGVWDTATGAVITELSIPRNAWNVHFAPGGKLLLAGDVIDVQLWDWAADKAPHTLFSAAKRDHAYAAALSAGGDFLAVPDSTRTGLFLVDTKSGKTLRALRAAGPCMATELAFSADGRWLVALENSALRNAAHVWDLKVDKESLTLDLGLMTANRLAISPDSSFIAIGESYAGVFGVWETKTGHRLGGEEVGQESGLHSLGVWDGGRRLASASLDGTIRAWDVATSKPLWQLAAEEQPPGPRRLLSHNLAIAASADGKWVATTSLAGTIRVVSTKDGSETNQFPGYRPHSGPAPILRFSADGKRLAAFDGASRQLRMWGLPEGKVLAERTLKFSDLDLPDDDPTNPAAPDVDLLETIYPQGQAFSENLSRMVATVLPRIYVFDVETGRETQLIETRGERVVCAALSPDGKRIAACQHTEGKKVKLADGREGRLPNSFLIRLRDAEAGDLIREIAIPGEYFGAVTFSPDGTLLATSVRRPTGTIFAFDSATGKELVRLHSGDAFSLSLAISPDNKTLYSGMSDTSVLVWDLPAPK